jgi:hypothetical protein
MTPAERKAYEEAALKTGGGFWPGPDPVEGAHYCGNFVAMVEVPNTLKKGAMQRKYTFQNEKVTTSIYGAAVLDSELDSLALEVGDRVLILFKGLAENHKPGQRPAKLFSAVKLDATSKKR